MFSLAVVPSILLAIATIAGSIAAGLLTGKLRFREMVSLVLIPSGVTVCMIGLLSAGFFRRLEEK